MKEGVEMSGDNTEKEIAARNLVATAHAVADGPKSGEPAERAMEELLEAIQRALPIFGEEQVLHIISGNGKNGNELAQHLKGGKEWWISEEKPQMKKENKEKP